MSIKIDTISKYFGNYKALDNISLDIPSGKLVALLGPSGSGKTSLLRIIAGLEHADEGQILFDEQNITERTVKERKIGFVFQHYALFRHMTVFDNVAFGLQVRPKKVRPSKAAIKDKVEELLALVKLDKMANRYPTQLSGGQRQRVALARAIAVEPKVLLLDEPFGALDAKVRKGLRKWLRTLHNEIDITSVFVTHDQEEALDVADIVIVMNKGRIEQIGTPQEVYDHPASPFVYDFLGDVNLFRGRMNNGKLVNGAIEFDAPELAHSDKEAISYVRPHNITVEREASNPDMIKVEVIHIHAIGAAIHLEMKRTDLAEFIEVELSREQFTSLDLKNGDFVFVRPNQFKVFVPEDYVI